MAIVVGHTFIIIVQYLWILSRNQLTLVAKSTKLIWQHFGKLSKQTRRDLWTEAIQTIDFHDRGKNSREQVSLFATGRWRKCLFLVKKLIILHFTNQSVPKTATQNLFEGESGIIHTSQLLKFYKKLMMQLYEDWSGIIKRCSIDAKI